MTADVEASVGVGECAALEVRTRALLDSDALTPPTRQALQARLNQRFAPSDLLSPAQRRTLEAVSLRLIPEPELVHRTALAAAFEARLAQGLQRGWRYAKAPDDLSLHRAGLDALDASARAQHGRGFADLASDHQDALLKAASDGEAPMAEAPEHWFEELLTALTEIYYAHPLVQVSIGYDGMADAHGAQAVGFQAVAAEAERLAR